MKQTLLILLTCALGASIAEARRAKVLRVENNTRLYNYTRNPVNIRTVPRFDFINKSVKQGFEQKSVKKNVPKLDLHSEPRVLAPQRYVLKGGRVRALTVKDFPKLKQGESPTLKFDFNSVEPKPIATRSQKIEGFNDKEVVNPKMAANIKPKLSTPPKIALKPTQLRDKRERDFLTLAILYHERKACPEVMTLGHYLKSKGYNKPEVDFFLGSCQHQKKLYSESVPLLAAVIKSGIDYYTRLAVEDLLKDLPAGYDQVIAEALAPKSVYRKLTQRQKDFYNYILAKGRFIDGKYKDSSKLAQLVSPESRYYREALYLEGVSEYMQKNLKPGIQALTKLAAQFKGDERDEDLYSLSQISLGRFYFEQGNYKASMRAYDSVRNKHPLWFDALLEKGWAQVRLKKYPEAIGNMYTLHSPFFNTVFKPETYVIQTIGYLNMCQFGSADQTLTVLERQYPQWGQKVKSYLKSNKSTYKTLMTYLKAGKSDKDVHGLPYQVVREMGRDKEFITIQKKLNNIIDEIGYYQNAVGEIMDVRKNIKGNISGLTRDLKEINNEVVRFEKRKRYKKMQEKEVELSAKQQELALQSYRLSLIDQGLSTYRNLTGDSKKRVTQIRDAYIKKAEDTLRGSLVTIDKRIEKVLRNNDLLRYEVFANSGKNVRYRAAGGKVSGRIPAKAIEKTKKNYGWKFKGEFWLDEVGKFVANVKDLCPKKR